MEKVDSVEYLDEYLTGKTWFSFELFLSLQFFVVRLKILFLARRSYSLLLAMVLDECLHSHLSAAIEV